MTPAAVFVAPALVAIRLLAQQIVKMGIAKDLAEALNAELRYANTLLLHAGRSDSLATDHAALLNIICGSARNASRLVDRISRRGRFMTFLAAGSDGDALRESLRQLHERCLSLGTAAAVAGAMGVAELPDVIISKVWSTVVVESGPNACTLSASHSLPHCF